MAAVSIIIPVYNVEKYLRRCLRSVFAQTYQDFEVICVEDAGVDSSLDILEEFADKYPDRMHVICNEENIGPGRSRDKALANAKGTYICYVDADDYILPDFLAQYVKKIEETAADVVIGGYRQDSGNAGSELITHLVKDNEWACVTYVTAWARLYRKEFVVNNHMRFERFTCLEDMYFNLMGYVNKIKYVVISDYAGYIHSVNDQSVTARSRDDKTEDATGYVIDVFDKLGQVKDFRKLSQNMRWMLQYAYVANMVNALAVYSKGISEAEMKSRLDAAMDDFEKRFPDYRRNPYLGVAGPKGQTAKIRLGVSAFMSLRKLGLDKKIFALLARLNDIDSDKNRNNDNYIDGEQE